LRSTGIGFLMITLGSARSCGMAYRWRASPTATTDNVATRRLRPEPGGCQPFYYATLVTFLLACWPWDLRALAVRASLRGNGGPGSPHDALGLQRLADPVLAILFSASGPASPASLFLYYNKFVSPQV